MGINELQAKLKEDSALAEKFKACKNLDEVIALAKDAGFEISAEDFESLTNVSAADLRKVAGGIDRVTEPCIFTQVLVSGCSL